MRSGLLLERLTSPTLGVTLTFSASVDSVSHDDTFKFTASEKDGYLKMISTFARRCKFDFLRWERYGHMTIRKAAALGSANFHILTRVRQISVHFVY